MDTHGVTESSGREGMMVVEEGLARATTRPPTRDEGPVTVATCDPRPICEVRGATMAGPGLPGLPGEH